MALHLKFQTLSPNPHRPLHSKVSQLLHFSAFLPVPVIAMSPLALLTSPIPLQLTPDTCAPHPSESTTSQFPLRPSKRQFHERHFWALSLVTHVNFILWHT